MRKIFTNFLLLAAFFIASANLNAQTYNGGTWYSLYDLTERSIGINENYTYSVFSPTLGNLTFDAKRDATGIGDLQVAPIVNGAQQSDIYSQNPGKVTKKIFGVESKVDYTDNPYSATTPVNLTQLKFYTKIGASYKKYFKNIKLPLAKHILIADGGYGKSSESKSFENVTIGGTSNVQTVNLRSFLTTNDITITSDNSAFRIGSANNTSGQTFAVGANACASTNGSGAAGGGNLGNINQYPINIYFCPTEVKEYSATITITDGTSKATISVSGVGVKKNQTINWKADYETEIKLPVGKSVEDAATATSGNAVTYTSEDESIVAIINNGAAFKAIKEGTTTITATQAGDAEWNAVSDTKTVTVTNKKIQSIVWLDNLTRLKVGDNPMTLSAAVQLLVDAETSEKEDSPERTALLAYASANKDVVSVSDNVLTIVGEGETTLTASVEGDENFEAASVTVPVKVRVPSAGCEDILLVDQPAEIEFFAMNKNEIVKDAIAINTSAGVPNKLTFLHKGGYYKAPIINTQHYSGSIKAQQSTDGGNQWSDIAGSSVTPTLDTYNELTVQLDENATHIRFVRPKDGEGYHYVSGVVVTPAQYLKASVASITENSIVGDHLVKEMVINYANVKDEVLINHSNEDIKLSAEGLGNECGAFGSSTLTVTVNPQEIGTITDEIIISDAVSGMKVTIPVNITVKRNNQTIIWEQELKNLYTTDVVTLNATANTAIHYTSSDSTIAYAEGNTLVINKHGQVTITAVAVQSEKYEQAILAKDITINAVQPIVNTWPTVEPIAYAQALTTDMLVGGEAEVEGQFVWNTERNQTLVPGTHDLAVRFVPTNTNYYAPVDGTVAVTINKSSQKIFWNDSFENITVTDSVVLTAYAKTLVEYVVSDENLAYVTDNNVLYFTRGGNLQVTAYAIEDDYYLADACVRELTVLPAYPTIVTYPTASPISYGQKLGESVLSGGEASVSGSFAWADEEALLEAGEYHQTVSFTPDDQVSYKNIEIPVVVLVNPIAQTITWDLTTIEVRQGQSLQFNAEASSKLPITYSVDNTALAKVENNTFYALEVGEVIVTATQNGSYIDEDGELHANYIPAEPVSKTIIIIPQQSPQTIVWNDDLDSVLTTADITLSAEAETPIHYLSSDSTIAYVEADKLIIKRFGTLTITAVAQQTEDYDQAILEKEVNIVAATPNIIAWPTVPPVTYGTKLNVTMLVDGDADVDGYFDWNTDLSQELVPGTYTLGVRFVPANLNIYAKVFDSVEVIVNKAPQTIVWNNNFENVLVSDTIVLNAYAQTTITYEVSDVDVAALEGNILSFHRGGTINVTAYAAETDLYLADTLVHELIVTPAEPIIYAWPTASGITYGQSLGESILTGGEASTDGIFEWVDANEKFEVGISPALVRFTPDDLSSFDIVENQIEIHVTPALQTIEWDLTDFVMEVGDTLHLTAVATSGLEITYTLDDEELAEISGNVLTALEVGMVTITASQNGVYVDEFGEEYDNYLPAKPVSQRITIVAKEVNTGTEVIFDDAKASKIIRDGRLYIIRNGHLYNANGQVIE